MNNNVPNNNTNGNNNEGLNAVSLGSVDMSVGSSEPVGSIPPVPPVEPVAPVEPVEPVSAVSPTEAVPPVSPVEPVDAVSSVPPVSPVNDVPSLDQMSTGTIPEPTVNPTVNSIPPVEPVQPVSYDVPETINNFSTTPVFNEIGTVPPISNGPVQPTPSMNTEEPKPKKKTNKLIFVIIIVLLIAAVGVGVYIFLNVSNKPVPVSVIPKEVEIEAGSEISTDISDYATFTGINSANCSLDTSSIVNTDDVGSEYTFIITCGANNYEGTATIVDTTAPTVTLQDVTVQVGGNVSADDFIDTCDDASECSYEFEDADAVNEYLSTANNYHVNIVVRDEAGNETTVQGTLYVTEDEVPVTPDIYLSCTLNDETLNFGMVENTLTGTVSQVHTFTFTSASEYNSFKTANGSRSSVTYSGVTGTPAFNDDDLTLTLTEELTKEQLDQAEGTTLPTAYGELRAYYVGEGFTCSLQRP